MAWGQTGFEGLGSAPVVPPLLGGWSAFGLGQPAMPQASLIYSNGTLQPGWSSWSWGLSYQNLAARNSPAEGSGASLCLSVQPFGALSLRTQQAIPTEASMIGFYIRGDGSETKESALGALEFQLESSYSVKGGYIVSQARSLHDLLLEQSGGDASMADALLRAAVSGKWIPVKAWLSGLSLAPLFDRMTFGSCLQSLEACDPPSGPVSICMDHVVIVTAN